MENNTILVIDDDKNILAIIEMYLKKEQYNVKTCERGDLALQLFRETQPALVVLDARRKRRACYHAYRKRGYAGSHSGP